MASNTQFGRFASLVLGQTQGNQGLDLSQLRFTFRTVNNDSDSPNQCYVTVFNLAEKTVKKALKEFNTLNLDVGYEGNHAVIFNGSIASFRFGKQTNVDSYLEIAAYDGDLGYNFGVINQTLAPRTPPDQEMQAYADAMGVLVDPAALDYVNGVGGTMINPRGKVCTGLARYYMRAFANTFKARWFIDNGVLKLVPLTGYLQGDIVKINSLTGMVGIPEATESGIIIKTLLNPLITIGGQVQVNNADVTQSDVKQHFFPGYKGSGVFIANTSRDGAYRVMVCEHEGDTRGEPWYSNLTCLNLDQSAAVNDSVGAFGNA